MLRNRGIAFKLTISFLTGILLVFAVIFTLNYQVSRRFIRDEVIRSSQNKLFATIYEIETVLRAVEEVPEIMADFLEHATYTKDELENFLFAVVDSNKAVYGSTIAFEPYGFDPEERYFSPYVHRSGGKVAKSYLGGDDYKYFDWDWYSVPKETNESEWTDPYYDEGGGNILMATYSVPFYKKTAEGRKFKGIATADIDLKWLADKMSKMKFLKTGYAFLISKSGTIVTHPHKDLIMKSTMISFAKECNNPDLADLGERMMAGEEGRISCKSETLDKESLIFYATVPATGWSLAVVLPKEELFADVTLLTQVLILIGSMGMLFLAIAIIYIARSITRPIREIVKATDIISTGNLDADLPKPKSGDEIGKLIVSFDHMRESLKKYIKELTTATAAKEHIESELNVARDIQMSILPKRFPAFPDNPEFDVYAHIQPAREVGGDFYDFYLIDEDRLCFIVGDVSGKGVPASLLMAVTKTMLKAKSGKTLDTSEVMSMVNDEISRDSDSGRFITVFYGILNFRTGEVSYTNGGHNQPVIVRCDGEAEFVQNIGGMVIGVIEGTDFEIGRFKLQPGESLFLYTDGVTEAMNSEREQFEEERMLEALEGGCNVSLRDRILKVLKRLKEFTKRAPQSDDITMMILEYNGDKKMLTKKENKI